MAYEAAAAGSYAAYASYATYAAMAISAASMVAQARARSASYRAQQQIGNYTAGMLTDEAQSAVNTAGAREQNIRQQGRVVLGEQSAGLAQSGVDPGSGSALAVAGQSGANAELDALNTRYQGTLQAHGIMDQATMAQYGAGIAGSNVGASMDQGYLSAGAGLASSGAMMYGYATRPTMSGMPYYGGFNLAPTG